MEKQKPLIFLVILILQFIEFTNVNETKIIKIWNKIQNYSLYFIMILQLQP